MVMVRRWTGREARALRQAVRMSVRAFAENLGVNARTVAKWEKLRAGTVPRPDTQAILDTALNRAGADAQQRFRMLLAETEAEATAYVVAGMAFTDAWRLEARTHFPDEGQDASQEEDAGISTLDAAVDDLLVKWDDVWRREFLKNTGAIAAVGLPSGRGCVLGGQDLMDAHVALRAAQSRVSNLCGSGAVYHQAVEHHRQVVEWYSAIEGPGERQRVAAFASNTGGYVAFLSYDLGYRDAALRHYRDAANLARRAGDLSHCANVFGQMSRILADQGRYDRAFEMTDGALHLAGTKAHPAVRSWLHAIRAFNHACLGELRAMHVDLDAARSLFARAHDGEIPMYINYLGVNLLGAAVITNLAGHAIARITHAPRSLLETGRTALQEAHAAWPEAYFRGSAELLTATARIHGALGERDAAAASASRAITIAVETGSARNLRAARATHAAVTAAALPS